MKTINDSVQLNYFLRKYHIMDNFDKDIRKHMTLHEYARGEDILVSGDEMHYFYFIVEGKAKIFLTTENGKSVLLRFTRPLSELGSLEALHKTRIVNSNVQSVHGTKVIRFPFKLVDDYLKEDVSFLRFIVNRLSHKLATESNKSSINVTYPFKNRFASYLLSISKLESYRIDEIKIDQMTDLATFLGTSYRHLTRTVKYFVEEGIISKEKNSFIIKDYQRLEKYSGGFYE